MSKPTFEITEAACHLPAGIESADPIQRLVSDIQLVARLRKLLRKSNTDHQQAFRKHLLKLLEVADALQRMSEVAPNPDSPSEQQQWNGIRLTGKLLEEILRLQEVTPIDLLGQPADPMVCEIDSYEVRLDLPAETVVQELIKGYRWSELSTPLRQAVVVVSRLV